MRLWGGRQSLFALMQRYSFFDASGCAYSADSRQAMVLNAAGFAHTTSGRGPDAGSGPARGAYALRCQPRIRFTHPVPCHVPVRNVGVAQLSARSGICWWGSLWFAVYFNPACRGVLDAAVARMPQGPASAVLRESLPRVLRDAAASERLRRALFEHYAIGDPPDQPPELDGQNAYAQLQRLCRHLRVPLTTLRAPPPGSAAAAPAEVRAPVGGLGPVAGLLGVRAYRGRYVPPFALLHGGRAWRLSYKTPPGRSMAPICDSSCEAASALPKLYCMQNMAATASAPAAAPAATKSRWMLEASAGSSMSHCFHVIWVPRPRPGPCAPGGRRPRPCPRLRPPARTRASLSWPAERSRATTCRTLAPRHLPMSPPRPHPRSRRLLANGHITTSTRTRGWGSLPCSCIASQSRFEHILGVNPGQPSGKG